MALTKVDAQLLNGAVTADSSGNVGIGTASPAEKLTVNGASRGAILATGGTVANYFTADSSNSAGFIGTGSAHPLAFITSATERMRIDANGYLMVGTTSTNGISGTTLGVGGSGTRYIDVTGGSSGNGGLIIGGNGSYNQSNLLWNYGGNYVQLAANPASSQVRMQAGGSGGVYLGATATAWAALSDETTKTDLQPIENAVDKVSTLRSVTGRYKTDDESTSRAFLIAQDVQKVLPEAVNVQDKETGLLGLQYSDVIPLLVAAIKELKAEVDATKAEVALLKAGA